MADLDGDVATAAANEDDFDLTADLTAAFDAAEEPATADVPEPVAVEETAEQKAERQRDDKGRFAKADTEAVKAVEPAKAAEAVKPAEAALPVQSTEPVAVDATLRPPPGWSPAAKVAFNALPAEVQQAVAKRETEVNNGLAKLAEYKPIERYAEMARSSGTTLDKALDNYIGIENELRRDFLGGIAGLCQRQGINPVALAQSILARHGVSPSSGDAGETQQAHQTAPSVDLSPIMQEISALKNYVQTQEQASVKTEIDRFASNPKHQFFDNVKPEMKRLLDSGLAENLEDAYDKACWSNSEIRDLLIKQQSVAAPDLSAKAAAASQARQAAKSITGSPIAGASQGSASSSIEDEIRAAFEAASV